MKRYWMMLLVSAGLLTMCAFAQTSAGGSASGNASVQAGQAGASTSTSANANVAAQKEHENQHPSGSKAATNASGSGTVSSGTGSASAGLSNSMALQAELTKSLDARHAKAGDEVTAKLTQDVKADGKVVLHKGSRLVGHVTQAQAHTKEHAESTLGIVFDKAVAKSGEQTQLNATIRALAPPASAASSASLDEASSFGTGGGMAGGRSGGGGLLGGVGATTTSAVGSTVGAAGSTIGSTTGSVTSSATGAVGGTVNNGAIGANGLLTTSSQGVFGMQGLALNSATAGSAQGSVLTSAKHNVKLESGTQMVLQTTPSIH